ncbi:MAG: phage portal protein [Muribaculaceae bacterium]|nr:phage portal protein [Muribaculaceae bacterium]MCM1439345.1 phage portal protein [Roseburia sp.]
MKPNILDRAIAGVAPKYAMQRMAARSALSFLNSGYGNYGANQTKKTMRGWMFYGGSAKEDIEDNIDILRQRSRDAYMGIPTAAAALKTMRTNVIAGGLMPAPQIDGDYLGLSQEQVEKLQAQIIREFGLWADTAVCDADRMDDFYKLQQLAFLGAQMNGDAIAVLPTGQQKGQPYSLRVKIIEADRLCSPDGFDRLAPCEVQGHRVHRIVQGVETDQNGMVVAYWICNHHPLGNGTVDGTEMKWVRVEAYGELTGRRNVLHIITRERAGQLRGVPILAPVLESLKQLGRYTEAEINAAVISAMFTVFVQPQMATDGRPFGEMIPPEQLIDTQDQGTIELGTGAIVSLNPGETVQFADPKHPNNGYDAFSGAMIKQIGAALEIPPEVMGKQFSTSYSAARGALNEFWRVCEMWRDWFATDFCQPIYEEWLAEAVALGRIKAPGFFSDPAIRKAYSGCKWNGPARTNLNPVQEVSAAVSRVDAGFSTAQEETAQMTSGNYAYNIRQRAAEAKMKREVDDIIHPPQKTPEPPTDGAGGKEHE